jgi:hypothetical protein
MKDSEIRDNQQEKFDKNLDELDDDKKEVLLKIGKKLLNIQNLMNKQKVLATKDEEE